MMIRWYGKGTTKVSILLKADTNGFWQRIQLLQTRRIAADNSCPVCRSAAKSVDHLFRECPFTRYFFLGIMVQPKHIYHEGAGQNAFGIIAFIKAYITENDNLEEVSTTMQTPVDRKWGPPIGTVMKLNFDAAFHQHTNISISGIIARNTEGQIMAACTHLNEYVMDSTVAEAPACLQSLIFAEDLGF
ncbi:hypothetical protein J1N35_022000 [Gossypium stocksii]|uniref:Reverse transcriptase zinc-binding domain-containing protein n=1 Tax=Gossypium stocksii TaxID=47602 RepID=A0A9D4A312_9ROSI|nr:hypothetical protein J1N35_022000 [Gossypium stocksii]